MAVEWRDTTLGELADASVITVQTGPFGSQLHSYDYVDKGVRVVSTEAIGFRRLNTAVMPQITPATANKLSRHIIRTGDIVFARRGAQATGLSAIAEPEHEGYMCGTGALRLRINDSSRLSPTFLSFALIDSASRQWLRAHAVGAVMPNLNEEVIRGLPLLLPDIREQQAIACVLGALDDKIELNRRMNQTLEAMARALFQSWFVDFDPVRAKATGQQAPGLAPRAAELFPVSFEESDLGEIPRGWRAGTFGDIAEERRRSVSADDIPESTPYIGLEHMPRRSITLGQWAVADAVASGKLRFRHGEILFGKLRPYFHKVSVAPVDGLCSTDIVVLGPRFPELAEVVLGHSSSDEFVAHTDRTSAGTKMPRTNWRDMSQYRLVIPPPNVASHFSDVIAPSIQRIQRASEEDRILAALRDALLPKLISGELRVPDAERIVGRCL